MAADTVAGSAFWVSPGAGIVGIIIEDDRIAGPVPIADEGDIGRSNAEKGGVSREVILLTGDGISEPVHHVHHRPLKKPLPSKIRLQKISVLRRSNCRLAG